MSDRLISDSIYEHQSELPCLWYCPERGERPCTTHPGYKTMFTFEKANHDGFRKVYPGTYWCVRCLVDKDEDTLKAFKKFLEEHPDIALEI